MAYDFTSWTIVFDLDGTLVETAPDLHAALNHTLAIKQLAPVSLESIRMMIGDGAKALIRKGLAQNQAPVDEDEIDQHLWPTFLDHYLENITRLSVPFEMCRETLEDLRAHGANLTVCTNKAQHLAEQVLKGLDLERFFSATVGGDALAIKKPDGQHIIETVRKGGGDPARTIMVGDAWTDERAARDAELPFVFVSFGYGSLSNQPYDRLRSIDHWRNMQQALSELARLD
ncbi:MAG: HAD hydrolase-like protein [Pseudomonadota bacterium]